LEEEVSRDFLEGTRQRQRKRLSGCMWRAVLVKGTSCDSSGIGVAIVGNRLRWIRKRACGEEADMRIWRRLQSANGQACAVNGASDAVALETRNTYLRLSCFKSSHFRKTNP